MSVEVHKEVILPEIATSSRRPGLDVCKVQAPFGQLPEDFMQCAWAMLSDKENGGPVISCPRSKGLAKDHEPGGVVGVILN